MLTLQNTFIAQTAANVTELTKHECGDIKSIKKHYITFLNLCKDKFAVLLD